MQVVVHMQSVNTMEETAVAEEEVGGGKTAFKRQEGGETFAQSVAACSLF